MGLGLQKLLSSRVVVVFGATSRIGKATIELLHARPQLGVTVVAAVENPKDPRVQRLKQATGCYVARCDYGRTESMQRVVRHADAVLLVPALSETGTRFSKRVVDAVDREQVGRLVVVSSVLATSVDDVWPLPGAATRAAAAPHPARTLGYEAVEAHARSMSSNCVALRIPLLMETVLYCREEIQFADRFFSCFAPSTPIPCIAERDVALAAVEILSQPRKKFNATYSLASADAMCTPRELEQLFAQQLRRRVRYRQVSDARLTELLQDKGVSAQVGAKTIRLKACIEASLALVQQAQQREDNDKEQAPALDNQEQQQVQQQVQALAQLLGASNDFRALTARSPTLPRHWLREHAASFERPPASQMQLFVLGSGEALFQEVERLVAQQVTAPQRDDEGEAAIPATSRQSKATFCTIKSLAGGTGPHRSSPMTQLLEQLTTQDVVVFIPPLHLGPQESMDVLRAVVDATQRARVWGLVLLSSVFIGRGWNDSINRMAQMEELVEHSGVPFVILRLPLFMEYFLSLEAPSSPRVAEPAPEPAAEPEVEVTPSEQEEWLLLDRSLATSPQYLISTTDAAKALVAVAYTFPLHRKKTRVVYTERRTMQEIERVLQRHAHKGRRIELGRIDALRDAPTREFWRVAYWTRAHLKQFLEASVRLSAGPPLPMLQSFAELTECQPITLEMWARHQSKSYTQALAMPANGATEKRARERPERETPQGIDAASGRREAVGSSA
ncbi:hypothetical protein P43SY_004126 [Pythium insidiosum]|uniref:NmrA-like domain-containing protein n=1 Tax=Pythium insidiosum TaxID=114742 RepID=A0AAD5M194_PYTIN|nr:hypothetical protein P43SY_004126 [Pythium insidiosum]